ncbi:hypothetical protein HA402_002055 [Bradysia odoriphaga]|nr:hypothetical protein HA402_002055 [Bradysia odoriphaga]
MKLSFIIELLLICILVAFAAGGVVEKDAVEKPKQQEEDQPVIEDVDEVVEEDDVTDGDENDIVQEDVDDVVDEVSDVSNDIADTATVAPLAPTAPTTNSSAVNENDPNPINRYCTCSESTCKCCREIGLPILPVRGPGCATMQYLEDDKMLVTIQYGDFVIAQRQISGRRATPICIPLPGGYSRFCGRVYGISRKTENFKACLALELRAEDEVEAALRVSCFQFGPKGLAVAEAEPLPPVKVDDDEDDDDLFGLGGGSDDDDYDDDEDGAGGGGGGLAGFLGGLGGGGGFGSGLVSGVAGLFGL